MNNDKPSLYWVYFFTPQFYNDLAGISPIYSNNNVVGYGTVPLSIYGSVTNTAAIASLIGSGDYSSIRFLVKRSGNTEYQKAAFIYDDTYQDMLLRFYNDDGTIRVTYLFENLLYTCQWIVIKSVRYTFTSTTTDWLYASFKNSAGQYLSMGNSLAFIYPLMNAGGKYSVFGRIGYQNGSVRSRIWNLNSSDNSWLIEQDQDSTNAAFKIKPSFTVQSGNYVDLSVWLFSVSSEQFEGYNLQLTTTLPT